MTAVWEQKIGRIEKREESVDTFLDEICGIITGIVHSKPEPAAFESIAGNAVTKCLADGCNGAMKKIKGKNGVFWGCQSCKETFNDKGGVPQPKQAASGVLKEAPCPTCGGTAKQKNGQYGLYWRCGGCDQFFRDVNGEPVIKTESKNNSKKGGN